MGRVFGSACLIAGTAIGAGILALPMVLIHLSLSQSLILMLGVWMLAYYSALLGSELVLRAQAPLSLGDLSQKFAGSGARFLGQFCFLGLCFALLSAYLSGTASLLHVHLPNFSLSALQFLSAVSYLVILVLSMSAIDKLNRVLFIIMLCILTAFTAVLAQVIDWSVPVVHVLPDGTPSSILATIPVVFTSFGFQIIFHTIGDYLGLCPQKMKRSFFWGSLIPVVLYILWTCISVLAIVGSDAHLAMAVKTNSLDVGQFMSLLGTLTQSSIFASLSWFLSILAIVTSAIGVGLGLMHTLEVILKNRFFASVLTILPAYFVVSFIPGAFIQALGFAGMILVVIALLLPMYLLYRSDDQETYYPLLSNKLLRLLVILVSFGIMAIEIAHLLKWL